MPIHITVYSTFTAVTMPDFPFELQACRTRKEHADLVPHLDEFLRYVLDTGNGTMTSILYNLMRHIQRVQTQYSLLIEECHLDDMVAWLRGINGICFLPDGTVRSPSGRILASRNSDELDAGASVPFPVDARQRKERSEVYLQSMQVRVPAALPPVIGLGEVELRSAFDVAGRALALFVVGLRAESLVTGHPLSVDTLQSKFSLGFSFLSPLELAFLQGENDENLTEKSDQLLWRYESLGTLLWALGLTASLPFPISICDVSQVSEICLSANTPEFLENSRLRSGEEILDALDEHMRMHWAARQARMGGRDAPGHIIESVVAERHYALNWLVHFGHADWDAVNTPT